MREGQHADHNKVEHFLSIEDGDDEVVMGIDNSRLGQAPLPMSLAAPALQINSQRQTVHGRSANTSARNSLHT